MVCVDHIGHQRQAPCGAPRPDNNNTRIATPVQEERPHLCPHVRLRLSHC
jgi:hypothetical protein